LELSSQKREEIQLVKRQRSEKADAIQRLISNIEVEYEQITRNFDEFYSDLLQQKEKLERESQRYMQAIAQRLNIEVYQ
jgi:hypothetical protein